MQQVYYIRPSLVMYPHGLLKDVHMVMVKKRSWPSPAGFARGLTKMVVRPAEKARLVRRRVSLVVRSRRTHLCYYSCGLSSAVQK